MDAQSVYRVVIESSNGQERYQKEYMGPATSEDDAINQARTVFKERKGDRLLTVEVVPWEAWGGDNVTLPPDGDDWITL